MTLRTLAVAELQISPLNVRKREKPVDALAENIAARGMMLPLIVHRMDLFADLFPDWGDSGGNAGAPYGVYAGSRRLRAIRQLIAAGRLPADHPVECIERRLDPASTTDESLGENLLRHDLDPWEVHAAVARSVEQGHTVDQIAATLGQSERWVAQQLRLGRLAPQVFAAYAEGKLSIGQATAYAATGDRALQLAAWSHFEGQEAWRHSPGNIRAFYRIGDRELDKLLRFVGAEAYREAGGRFELDLFADGPEERGRVIDEGVLRELAEARLEETRESIRARTGQADLRFAKEPPRRHGATDWSLRIEPEGKKHWLPEGDVVATLTIEDDGEIEVGYWWASARAKSAARRAALADPPPPGEGDRPRDGGGGLSSSSGAVGRQSAPRSPHGGGKMPDDGAYYDFDYAQAARRFVKDEFGFAADGLQVVRSMRRALLRAAILAEALGGGTLGRDYLIWSQARQEFGNDRWRDTGARALSSAWGGGDDAEPVDVVEPFLAEMLAHAGFAASLADLAREPFMIEQDPADSLALYVALPEETKSWVAALVAGAALIRSANVPGWRVRAHDKLAELSGHASDAKLRHFCPPTPTFIGLLPKLKRLELAQPHVDPDAFRTWHKQDDKTITGACAGALEAAEGWIHPLLGFNVGPEDEEQRQAGQDPQPLAPDPDPGVNDKAEMPPAKVPAA